MGVTLMPRYFGIDPGNKGGICYLEDGIPHTLSLSKREKGVATPLTDSEIWSWFSEHLNPSTDFAMIELVSGYMPGEKKVAKDGHMFQVGVAPGSVMFDFGVSYGTLRMALTALGLTENQSWVAIRPQQWQKSINVITRGHLPPRRSKYGESRNQFKSRLRSLALSLFPSAPDRITLGTCDAILLAMCCRDRFEKVSTADRSASDDQLSLWE